MEAFQSPLMPLVAFLAGILIGLWVRGRSAFLSQRRPKYGPPIVHHLDVSQEELRKRFCSPDEN